MFHVHGHGACGALEILVKSVDADHVVEALVEPYDALGGVHVLGHSCWGALESLATRVEDDHVGDALLEPHDALYDDGHVHGHTSWGTLLVLLELLSA